MEDVVLDCRLILLLSAATAWLATVELGFFRPRRIASNLYLSCLFAGVQGW